MKIKIKIDKNYYKNSEKVARFFKENLGKKNPTSFDFTWKDVIEFTKLPFERIREILQKFYEKELIISGNYLRFYKPWQRKDIPEEFLSQPRTSFDSVSAPFMFIFDKRYNFHELDEMSVGVNEYYLEKYLNIIPKILKGEHVPIETKIISETEKEKLEFIDDKAVIKLGTKICQLPPFKNEHFFCRAVFKYPINKPIDWSVIYEEMTGYHQEYFGKPKDSRENWRVVYDTMRRLNKRIERNLGIKNLFIWQEKTIRRTH